jgi:hypothetical protein
MRYRQVLWVAVAVGLTFGAGPAAATVELTPAMDELYVAVGISPPTAAQMMPGVARSRAQSDSAGVRMIRPPGGPGSRHVQACRNSDIRTFDAAHNFDFWDATRNETSLLLVLQAWGVVRHHAGGDPRYRGNILVGQLPHNTAVIVEKTSGSKWVVDMWSTAYG